MPKIRFPENLAAQRKASGMTQSALAKELGVDQRTISAWEKHISEPSLENLAKLCDIFKVDFNTLLS